MAHRAARAFASIWRLNALRIARRVFANAEAGSILTRPFFDGLMPVDIGRSEVHQLLYLEGERFIAERFLMQQLLAPGMAVVDVGANIGYYLLLFEHVVGPTGRVLCIEPEPDNVADLRRVVDANRFENVRVLPMALGSRSGTAQLARGLNGVIVTAGTSVMVPVARLDDVWHQEGFLDQVDFVKIDVEGYEGEVLAGAQNLLAERKPRIFLEMHPTMMQAGHTIASIVAMLEERYAGNISFFELPHSGPRERIRAQYFGSDIVRPIARREILRSCEARERKETFWLVCS